MAKSWAPNVRWVKATPLWEALQAIHGEDLMYAPLELALDWENRDPPLVEIHRDSAGRIVYAEGRENEVLDGIEGEGGPLVRTTPLEERLVARHGGLLVLPLAQARLFEAEGRVEIQRNADGRIVLASGRALLEE
jgi:hypothetical protein